MRRFCYRLFAVLLVVPLTGCLGVAVGILTIGIIVPISTTYSCVEG